jgi:hypothetical protein
MIVLGLERSSGSSASLSSDRRVMWEGVLEVLSGEGFDLEGPSFLKKMSEDFR